ncbi:MAG: VIT1/CCC1 transporter family protein [Pseudomonadota bacterium]|nr:VIT1/CCC1 transporter family protein [Pseudomonadota bacterium]
MARPPMLEHSHDPADIARRLRDGPQPSYLRDWVYGGIDGTVTTFAIVAGAVGAQLSTRYLLILGAANLLADGLSMAASNFTGTRTEIEEYHYLRAMEERHIDVEPQGEREEIRQIFRTKGFEGQTLEAAVDTITGRRESWVDTMMVEEHGMAPMTRSPMRAALATFAAFVLCGSVPVLPFALGAPASVAVSAAMTGLTFFLIGSFRSRWSPVPWWRSGLETFAIGMASAGVAYAVGDVLQKLL